VLAYAYLARNIGQFRISQPVKPGTTREQLAKHYPFDIFAEHFGGPDTFYMKDVPPEGDDNWLLWYEGGDSKCAERLCDIPS